MRKLKLDNDQLDAMVTMLNASCEYYNKQCQNTTVLVDLATDVLRSNAIASLYNQFYKAQYKVKNSIMTIYRTEFVFSRVEALVFLGSIIPGLNNTYYDGVKQVVVDYSISVLKDAGILPNIPTYQHPVAQLAASYPQPFNSKSTSFYDFLEH
jgi:hypothetical protein